MKQLVSMIVSVLCLSLLSSCAVRPCFAVKNNSDEEIRIELLYDSLNLKAIVAKYLTEISSGDPFFGNCDHDPACDSTMKVLYRDRDLLSHYLYDSLPLSALFIDKRQSVSPFIVNEFSILKTSAADEMTTDKDRINLDRNLFDYYRHDTALMRKITSNNVVTLFVPSGYLFLKQCHASGDASCDILDAFPFAREIRVIKGRHNVVLLTRDNFKNVMSNERIRGESGSYLLEVN